MCEAVHYAAESVEKLLGCVTIQIKAILSNTSLFKVVLTFVYNTLNCEHSNESYWAVISCGTAGADKGKGPAPPPPLLNFGPNWCPKGRKKNLRPPSPFPNPLLYLGVWMTGPPPYLKVLIRHCTVYYTIRVGFNWNDWTKCESLTVLITAAVSFTFLFVLFIILWERVLTFEFVHVDEIWKCNHSDKSYCRLALSVIVR